MDDVALLDGIEDLKACEDFSKNSLLTIKVLGVFSLQADEELTAAGVSSGMCH